MVMARGRVWPVPVPWVALRCLALVAMYLTMYPALPLIDMALAGAAFYTAPLFIVGLSALVLGNRVTARHWVAILTGFAGVLVIVQPFGAAFSPVVLLPVAAAACYAGAAILTRARCAEVSPAVLGFWLNLAFLVVGGLALLALSAGLAPALDYPFLTGPWAPMTLRAWAVIAILALLMVGIAVGVAVAYQSPRPEVVASFDYAYMIFASFWGFVFFGRGAAALDAGRNGPDHRRRPDRADRAPGLITRPPPAIPSSAGTGWRPASRTAWAAA
jgi:drug/metabolite transporter (DMT)-like permease